MAVVVAGSKPAGVPHAQDAALVQDLLLHELFLLQKSGPSGKW
jgi:hypothetical protein